MAWSVASESMILGLPDLVLALKFLQPEWNFLDNLFTVQWSTAPSAFGYFYGV